MRRYLSSVQHIVGQQAVVRASKSADTASVPTSFLEELETLRNRVEELSDERLKLKSELNEQIAETNVLRALPPDRSPDSPTKVRCFDVGTIAQLISPLAVSEFVAQVRQFRGDLL